MVDQKGAGNLSTSVSGGNGMALEMAQMRVNETKNAMQQNVRKMIENQEELGDIENRAGELKNIAFNMKNNAE